MTDLHSHILPGIDDGAANLIEALSLLRAEKQDGVDTVALTPHFRTEMAEIANFVEKRTKAFELLKANVNDINLITGAEVAFSPELLNFDIKPLCYQGTQTVLIELPTNHLPYGLQEVLYELRINGYQVIIAHVERYPYIMKDRGFELLEKMVNAGIFIQVNANSLLGDSRLRKTILKLIKNDFVHIIATDAHSMENRPPELKKAFSVIEKKLDKTYVQKLINKANRVVGT